MNDFSSKSGDPTAAETILTHAGRDPGAYLGFVNTPVFRGSTIIFKTLDDVENYSATYRYGRNDNPTVAALAQIITEMEGAAGTVLGPSGLSAVTTALLSVLSAGDEILLSDSCYEPTRTFSSEGLARFGITARYYDPQIGAGIADLITDKTRAIFVESPGSLTFEMQDLRAIVAAAQSRDIAVIVDNTWATPLYHRPLELGADLVIHAATKMFVGHSDVLIGSVSANEKYWTKLKRTHRILGVTISPDDAYLTMRGLRTMAMRMKEHGARSVELAQWLKTQPGVEEVYHPALPDHPGHAIWQRDFSGAGSLFAFRTVERPRASLAAMVDGFRLFGMGYSWGGYESLCMPSNIKRIRTVVPWTAPGTMFRVHVGLENLDELKADLSDALARYLA
jgi:cystathionine beta-lyase